VLASIVFLTPDAALVAIGAVLPLAGFALAARRERRGRGVLGLAPPPARGLATHMAALLAMPALLGLAAAQPAIRSTVGVRVRTDAQALYVFDISRSMLASASPHAATRLERAKEEAIAMRAALPELPSGVVTLTDRVLPELFPVDDPTVFDDVFLHATIADEPPPQTTAVVATSLAALGALGDQNYFPPSVRKRIVVVLTDGESAPIELRQLRRRLAVGPGIRLVLIRVWAAHESVYSGGRPERGYHEDPSSGKTLAALARATGGAAYDEHALGSAIARIRADLGAGPSRLQGETERTRPLSSYLFLAALLPLLVLLGRNGGWRALRPDWLRRGVASSLARANGRRRSHSAAEPQLESVRSHVS
jgi:hypothetical protein